MHACDPEDHQLSSIKCISAHTIVNCPVVGVVNRVNWPSLKNLHTSHSHGFHKVSLVGASWFADLKIVFTSCMGLSCLDQRKSPFPTLRLHAPLLSPVPPPKQFQS